jgi:hypothetical protein
MYQLVRGAQRARALAKVNVPLHARLNTPRRCLRLSRAPSSRVPSRAR